MIFKYLENKRIGKENALKAEKERKAERERIREEEKNRIILDVPQSHVHDILKAYDYYLDNLENRCVNRFLLWREIEQALPETKERNWCILVNGSEIIKIQEVIGISKFEYQDYNRYHSDNIKIICLR